MYDLCSMFCVSSLNYQLFVLVWLLSRRIFPFFQDCHLRVLKSKTHFKHNLLNMLTHFSCLICYVQQRIIIRIIIVIQYTFLNVQYIYWISKLISKCCHFSIGWDRVKGFSTFDTCYLKVDLRPFFSLSHAQSFHGDVVIPPP
jgi:hypothetical protein